MKNHDVKWLMLRPYVPILRPGERLAERHFWKMKRYNRLLRIHAKALRTTNTYLKGKSMDTEFGQHETMLTAIRAGDHLKAVRQSRRFKHEVAVTIYADGAEDTSLVSFRRPQDFATRKAWRYFGIGAEVGDISYLIHGYIDVESTQEEFSQQLVSIMMGMGGLPISYRKEPCAPSDPLNEDDFWDEALGQPVFWDSDNYEIEWDIEEEAEAQEAIMVYRAVEFTAEGIQVQHLDSEPEAPEFAEVCIPCHADGKIYGICCWIIGKPADEPAYTAMMILKSVASELLFSPPGLVKLPQ
jgi:hypothetical protein